MKGYTSLRKRTYEQFKSDFPDHYVYRVNNEQVAYDAGYWARTKYEYGLTFTYDIFTAGRIDDLSKEYCTKFVAGAYVLGGLVNSDMKLYTFSVGTIGNQVITASSTRLILPEDIIHWGLSTTSMYNKYTFREIYDN
ncbi:hypothetical protein [Paenibacillus caui]|uniref:hypothetical protein n=1 Tax=Paenibacillus caui TaxID=2873927 RepID=UPI001CA8DA8E|nr:hypothetical protein [Paenibacillus caui]